MTDIIIVFKMCPILQQYQQDSVSSGSGQVVEKEKASESNPFLSPTSGGHSVEMKGTSSLALYWLWLFSDWKLALKQLNITSQKQKNLKQLYITSQKPKTGKDPEKYRWLG